MLNQITGYRPIGLAIIVFLLGASLTYGQSTTFTYQGKLADNGNPANGNYDFQFKLFDALSAGTQQGTTQTVTSVTVTNGIFNVQLNFGVCATCFNGTARFLEISVKPTSGGSFILLTPRQQINSTPYAIRSAEAASADDLSAACVSCVTRTQILSVNGSSVSGQIPVGSVPSGSANYIQNTTSQQATSNFNISGTGTANIFDVTTQYNLAGNRVFAVTGTGAGANSNTLAGVSAGPAITTGTFNSFFGNGAGLNTTTGSSNAFFGRSAGSLNTTGSFNTYIGHLAGPSFGGGAISNSTAIGAGATVTANNQVVLGTSAETVIVPGTLSGNGSGLTNLNANNISNSNAFFIRNQLSQQASSNFNISGNGTAGGTLSGNIVNATTQYNIGSVRILSRQGSDNIFLGDVAGGLNPAGSSNTFLGKSAGSSNTGSNNSFIGKDAGLQNTTGASNVFLGSNTGTNNITGSNNTLIGANAITSNDNYTFATAIGAGATAIGSNSIALGRFSGEDDVYVFGRLIPKQYR